MLNKKTKSPFIAMRKALLPGLLTSLALQALPMSAQAQGMPEITPSLKKMLGGLPIAGLKDDVQGMVAALKKTSCGGGLTGCYATQAGPIQLYFFTSKNAQQTFLLVLDKTMTMPPLLKDSVQKAMGGTQLASPIISISTTDYALDVSKMPAPLQKVVRDSYFNVSSLEFSSGVQLAARANLGGAIKIAMESLGVRADQLTMRAAVVMPIPTDLAGGAGTGAGLADAVSHGDTMKKAGLDSLKPEAFVEFQFAPNAKLPMILPPMNLTDATFFINNSLTFGYKGNAAFKGVGDKKFLIQFQTPLTPEGAMDLADFQFRMASPAKITMEDAMNVMLAMATPDRRLAKYGGGFIGNINAYKKALQDSAKPLSVFQLRNANPVEYRFADSTKPWPDDPKYFNFVIAGPLADDGPMMRTAGEVAILGQKMGYMDNTTGRSGMHNLVGESITIKLGPLGKTRIKMESRTDIDMNRQEMGMRGNFMGQAVSVVMSPTMLTIDVSASCVNPFEIKAKAEIHPSLDIAQLFEVQPGVNVDPSKIGGCIGKELEAALNKIAGEYKSLSGYTAGQANQALKKMTGFGSKSYEQAKDGARDVANKTANGANKAFNDAGNAFKKIGKKKKHKKGPDPKFAASVFDWDYYYDNNPDLADAKADLAKHWQDSGFKEGRQGSPEFNAKYYWSRYTDVQARCPNQDLPCALQHWLDYGFDDGRQGSANFSIASYLNRYPDLQKAFGKYNYDAAFDHWLNSGEDEGRDGSPASAFNGPVSGPTRAGGGGGGEWSDAAFCDGQYVTGFRLNNGKTVDRLQFRYPQGWASPQGGNNKFNADVTFANGEYITYVKYRSGDRLDNVMFVTNVGKTYGPYGGNGGSPGEYRVTAGEKLGCMSGRAGKSIDQLVFSSTGPR